MSGGAGTSGVHSVYELEAVAVEQWVHYLLQYVHIPSLYIIYCCIAILSRYMHCNLSRMGHRHLSERR